MMGASNANISYEPAYKARKGGQLFGGMIGMRTVAAFLVALFLGAAYWVGVEVAAALTAWLNSVGMGG